MDKGRSGVLVERYTLGDTRMARGLKERRMSWRMIALTHSSMSSMTTTAKRSRRKKLAKVSRSFENDFKYIFIFSLVLS